MKELGTPCIDAQELASQVSARCPAPSRAAPRPLARPRAELNRAHAGAYARLTPRRHMPWQSLLLNSCASSLESGWSRWRSTATSTRTAAAAVEKADVCRATGPADRSLLAVLGQHWQHYGCWAPSAPPPAHLVARGGRESRRRGRPRVAAREREGAARGRCALPLEGVQRLRGERWAAVAGAPAGRLESTQAVWVAFGRLGHCRGRESAASAPEAGVSRGGAMRYACG